METTMLLAVFYSLLMDGVVDTLAHAQTCLCPCVLSKTAAFDSRLLCPGLFSRSLQRRDNWEYTFSKGP